MADSLSREALLRRLAELEAQERQAFANYNAVLGALQLCRHLVAEAGKTEESGKAATA